jgi:hypothetical protein
MVELFLGIIGVFLLFGVAYILAINTRDRE